MTDNKVLIKVENLKKHYTGGVVKALDGVNCEIKKGEVVVIVGPSGSGKSTLLRSLNLLEIPTDGKIYFDGVDITDKKTNINTHRQRMGMVFQHFNLFPNMNVLKNMTKAGNIIAGRTFIYFIPLITVALIYLVIVMILSWLVGILERRLRKSDR